MADIKSLNDQEVEKVSGGAGWYDKGAAPHANGVSSYVNGMTYYTIASGDYLGNIAMRFGTTPNAIQRLNPGVIKNIDVIRAGDTIRVS